MWKVVDLPNPGELLVFILIEFCFYCPGLFGLEIPSPSLPPTLYPPTPAAIFVQQLLKWKSWGQGQTIVTYRSVLSVWDGF